MSKACSAFIKGQGVQEDSITLETIALHAFEMPETTEVFIMIISLPSNSHVQTFSSDTVNMFFPSKVQSSDHPECNRY
jgi:hypothetical protein